MEGYDVVKARKQAGRPRNPEPSANVCARVPAREFDLIVQAANRREMSVSAYVRRVLVLSLGGNKQRPR